MKLAEDLLFYPEQNFQQTLDIHLSKNHPKPGSLTQDRSPPSRRFTGYRRFFCALQRRKMNPIQNLIPTRLDPEVAKLGTMLDMDILPIWEVGNGMVYLPLNVPSSWHLARLQPMRRPGRLGMLDELPQED